MTIMPHPSYKLMMFQELAMCAFVIGVDGTAIISSMRADLLAIHNGFGAEVGKSDKL
jgi:hypothetical protein